MKVLIIAVIALCLVCIQADTEIQAPPSAVNYELMVEDVINDMSQIAKDAAAALQHAVEDLAKESLERVEEALDNIEAKRAESEECVDAEVQRVAATIDTMHKDLESCGAVAAKTSAEIMNDINKATQQLVFGGFGVLTTWRRCRRYHNSVLKKSCYARLSIKGAIYLANARQSIKTIRMSVNERIPAIVADAEHCTQSSVELTLNELQSVQDNIDACIAKLSKM